MSVEAISWALAQPVERSSAKFVLVAMANCAGPDMTCWPSMAYLTEATSQDRKTVLENVKRLTEAGYIQATEARAGRTAQVVVYRLTAPEKESQKRNSTENGTVPKTEAKSPVFPVKESRFSVETVPKTGHGTVIGTVIEPSGNKKGAAVLSQPLAPPPDFDGENESEIPPRALVGISKAWQLPDSWGIDAEALGWKPSLVLKEAEKFRQFFVSGKGKGKRRSLKGWRQSWSNWLGLAERYGAQ